MKLKNLVAGIFSLLILTSASLFAQQHFNFTDNTGADMTIVIGQGVTPTIDGVNIENGDEIGVFTPAGLCAGAIVWQGPPAAITVWGDDPQTPVVDGFKANEKYSFRIWDQSEDVEYSTVEFDLSGGTNEYITNQIPLPVVSSMNALKTPGAPILINYQDGTYGVATSGDFSVEPLDNTDTYTFQLSDQADFGNLLVNTTQAGNTLAYNGLDNNMEYHLRVRGTNNVGDGPWSEAMFTTELEKCTLVAPSDMAKGLAVENLGFSWQAVDGASSYNIQVAIDDKFGTIIVNETPNGTTFTANGLDNFQDYWWRVQALDGQNFGPWSSANMFQTVVGEPEILSPLADNCVGRTGILDWNAVDGATSYDVQLANNPNFTNPIIDESGIAATDQNYSNLPADTQHWWRVRASNADGTGDWTTTDFTTKLPAPNNLDPISGSQGVPTSGTLNWDNLNGAATYDVQIADNPGFINPITDQNGIQSNSFNYNGLNNNLNYTWRVRGVKANGCAGDWRQAQFETELEQAVLLNPVNNANLVPVNGQANWNAVSGATQYDFQVSTDQNFSNVIVNAEDIVGTSFNYLGLNSFSTHYARVRGKKQGSLGPWSNVHEFTTAIGATMIVAPADGAEDVTPTCTLEVSSVNGAADYDFQVATDANFQNILFDIPNAGGTSTVINNLDFDTQYWWRARAKDPQDNPGPWTNSTFRVQLAAPVLTSPADNAVDVGLSGQATWQAVNGETSYQIQFDDNGDFSSAEIDDNSATNSYTYSGLSSSTTYNWRVRAIKNGNNGAWSAPFSFTTLELPPPALVSPANNSMNLAPDMQVLTWDEEQLADSYDLQVATDEQFNNIFDSQSQIVGTDATIQNLGYGNEYWWRVRSRNAEGESNYSLPFKFKTVEMAVITGPASACRNATVNYEVQDIGIIDYQWSVIGGTVIGSSTMRTVTVQWTTEGTQEIKVMRSSAEWGNFTDEKSMEVAVSSSGAAEAEIDIQSYYEDQLCAGEELAFMGSSNDQVTKWTWTFGDNTPSKQGQNVAHTYAAPGEYMVTLTVEGGNCAVGVKQMKITIDENCPITIIMDDNFDVCKNSSPTFNNTVFGGAGGYTYSWHPGSQFVDPSQQEATVQNAQFSRSFSFTVKDAKGNQGIDQIYMTVLESPDYTFTRPFLFVNNNLPINLLNYINPPSGGTPPYTYTWKRDGQVFNTADNENPPIGFTKYSLVVSDANGCDSKERNFLVIKLLSKEVNEEDAVVGLNGGFMVSYPNPAASEITLYAQFDEMSNASVKLTDLLGNEVYSAELGTISSFEGSVDVSGITSGMYLIIIETDNNRIVKRFIKQ